MKTTSTSAVQSVTSATSDAGHSVWASRAFSAARYALGALLVFSVSNALFSFAPQPPMPAAAQTFLGGLFSAPYFFGLLKGTELLVALALITNRFVPLALVALAPVTVNIVLFHLVLAPEGAPIGVVLLVLHLATAWSRRASFRSVLAVK